MQNNKLEVDLFRELVFEVLCLVPKGRATSYGAIAKAIGYPNMSRLVGRVVSGSTALDIPAHRLVNSQGVLSGRLAFATPNTMQERLESEGIVVENNRIKNWKRIFWDPALELGLDK